jgi:predicted AAA+ superfamily ATPase
MENFFSIVKKNNYWEENQAIPSGFFRKIYQEKISSFLGKNVIKVLVGQRRVGKSFVMRQVIQSLIAQGVNRKNIFYLNKESFDFYELKKVSDLQKIYLQYEKEIAEKGKKYIFIDEVQEIEEWEKFVTSYSEHPSGEYEIFITGSNAHLLSGELSTYLSGRYIQMEIFPFIFSEYIEFLDLPKSKSSYLQFLKTGGLPFLLTLDLEEDQQKYVDTIKNTILLKDIVQRYSIKNSAFLERLFLFLVNNIGNIFSYNSILSFLRAKGEKTNYETISRFISYLSDSFLIRPVERYDLQGKTILEHKKKYYITDTAFRNFLLPQFDPFLGKQLENTLFIQFKSMGYSIYTGDIKDKEIDFILEKNGKKEYIQVAHSLNSQEVIDREFGNLEKIRDSYPKKVISIDDISFGNKNGIEHLLAWEIE